MRLSFKPIERRRLRRNIMIELTKTTPSIDYIMSCIDAYEVHNLNSIDRLNRAIQPTRTKISGAIKQTINAHGPITKLLINSATKRIYGALIIETNNGFLKTILKKIFK